MTPERINYLTARAVIEGGSVCDWLNECLIEIDSLQADNAGLKVELDGNDQWMRDVLTDFRIPFDDHKKGRRVALTGTIRDSNAELDRLRAIVEGGKE